MYSFLNFSESLLYISGSVPGVKIISFRITRLYEWEGQGLKLEVDKESFLSSVENCSLDIFDLYVQVLWAARMISSHKSSLLNHCTVCNFNISSLFKCNTVLRQRTRKFFLVWNLSQVDLPYQGAFSSFETIQRSHFCCTAIAGHKDTPQQPNYLRNYIVHIYTMQKNRCTTWNSTWPSRKTIQ